jgi:hypothetical protein
MIPAAGPDAQTHYRYRLRVEVEPTDASVLKDALEDEPFGLRQRYGLAEIHRQLDEFELVFEAASAARWEDFDSDLEVLSVYLSQYIVGFEVHVRPTAGAPLLRAQKVVACRGEVVRLEADVLWQPREQEIELGQEELTDLVRRWEAFPEWLRNAMRIKHPRTRGL